MSALSIPFVFQPALLPPSYENFLYHPLIKFLTSIYYFNCNTYHLNRKVKGLILNKKGCGKLPAVHVSGYTTRVNQWRRHEQDLKFFLYDSAGPKERKKLKRIIVPSYNSGVNFQLKECKKRKID